MEKDEEAGYTEGNLSEIIQSMVKEIKITYQVDKINKNVKEHAARKIVQAYPSLEKIGQKKITDFISSRFSNEATTISRSRAQILRTFDHKGDKWKGSFAERRQKIKMTRGTNRIKSIYNTFPQLSQTEAVLADFKLYAQDKKIEKLGESIKNWSEKVAKTFHFNFCNSLNLTEHAC